MATGNVNNIWKDKNALLLVQGARQKYNSKNNTGAKYCAMVPPSYPTSTRRLTTNKTKKKGKAEESAKRKVMSIK